MIKEIKNRFKRVFNSKGNDIVAVALVLLFLILGAMAPLKKLGTTVSNGITAVQKNMQSGFEDGTTELDYSMGEGD